MRWTWHKEVVRFWWQAKFFRGFSTIMCHYISTLCLYRQSSHSWRCPQPRARLPLLPTRLPITFPAAAHHRTLAGKIGTKCFTVNFIAAAPTVVRYSVIPQAITSWFMPRRDSNNKKNFIVFASYSDYATYLFISWTWYNTTRIVS